MMEKCPYCGNEFANTKALGSHIHYAHSEAEVRTDGDQQRFQHLLNSCLQDRGLRKPHEVEKIERAIKEIPPGISPILDKYREAFSCALSKEKLIKDVEKLLGEEGSNRTK